MSYVKRHHKAISVRFTEEEYADLKQIADNEDRKIHTIIKRAIDAYVFHRKDDAEIERFL